MLSTDPRKKLGDAGELAVRRYLEARGCRILGANVRISRLGELDLIVERGETIWAVEVKTRRVPGSSPASHPHPALRATFSPGEKEGWSPASMITPRKVAKMAATLEAWLRETGREGVPVEFLAATVTIRPDSSAPEIELLRYEG